MNSLRVLLSGVIDYAGLFPPASLDMTTTVKNYNAYRTGPHHWMLGRLIIPVERLEEFETVARPYLPLDADAAPWRLSVLTSAQDDMLALEQFRIRHGTGAGQTRVAIDTLEVKASNPQEIGTMATRAPKDTVIYFELPLDERLEALVQTVRDCGARAKVRTGGITPESFPTSEALVKFMSVCRRRGVPFKATAGLHHPIRSTQNLTYATDSRRGTMFGFLNVFLAAALLASGGDESDARCLLEEQSPSAFRFDEEGIWWRRMRLTIQQVFSARQQAAISFGSCSFTEPIADLHALKLL
jgi:hypothetical protein